MAILWMGAEDLDFPNGVTVGVNTSSGAWRSGFARCAINPSAANILCKSTTFPGGSITSGWLTFRNAGSSGQSVTAYFGFGSGNSGLFVGIDNSNILHIATYNGTTVTTLASGTGPVAASGSFSNSNVKIDMQLINYGATGTINVYANGLFALTYTGNLTLTGVTGFNSVCFFANGDLNNICRLSEIIVSDSTTLALQGLVTYAPSGNGTTQAWSNPAYTNINPTTINDANSAYTNATGQDEQATLNGTPSGNFQIQAVKIIARALATSGAASTNLKLGFNNTNNSTVAEGATHALGTAFAEVEDYFTTDPTSAGGTGPWGTTLNGYQLELRSS